MPRLPVRAEKEQRVALRESVLMVQEQPAQVAVVDLGPQPLPQGEQIPPRPIHAAGEALVVVGRQRATLQARRVGGVGLTCEGGLIRPIGGACRRRL